MADGRRESIALIEDHWLTVPEQELHHFLDLLFRGSAMVGHRLLDTTWRILEHSDICAGQAHQDSTTRMT
jgi:hypothetical protein